MIWNKSDYEKDILNFYKIRMRAHIDSVGYFCGLLGIGCVGHDIDKLAEPILTPYAFANYRFYHPDFSMPPDMKRRQREGHNIHHSNRDHHVEFYRNIAEMPDEKVMEMVCDWWAANLEDRIVNKLSNNKEMNVIGFYTSVKDKWGFTKNERKLIMSAIKDIESRLDMDGFLDNWKKVSELAAKK